MPTIYEVCDASVKDLVKKISKKFHPGTIEAEVSVECIFADAGFDKKNNPKPAVKLHGLPCFAIIKKSSVEQRAQGMSDATIIIDQHKWDKLSEPERMALIDHELEHISVQREDNGAIKTDEAGRPVIKLKPHDWELSGFRAIAERHKEAALEVQELIAFEQSANGQLVFSFKSRG